MLNYDAKVRRECDVGVRRWGAKLERDAWSAILGSDATTPRCDAGVLRWVAMHGA
jgi:hypothetical protein